MKIIRFDSVGGASGDMILGALIAFFLQWGLYDFVAMKVAEIDSLQLITVAPFLDVIEPVALIYALLGFLAVVVLCKVYMGVALEEREKKEKEARSDA